MNTEHADRTLPADGRLEVIDALRGFALLGVSWANLLIFAGISYMADEQKAAVFASPLDWPAYRFELFFIENKFMGLFSFLFGISFWLFLSRTRARATAPLGLYYRRIFWLFVIGAAHGWLLWCFDILRFYALWAVLLPLFVRTPPRLLLTLAVSAAAVVPACIAGAMTWLSAPAGVETDFDALALATFSAGAYRDVLAVNWRYDWDMTMSVSQVAYQVAVFGRLLLGLYVARTLDLGTLAVHRALLRRMLVAGVVAGVIGSSVFTFDLLAGASSTFAWPFVRRLVLEAGQLGMTLAYACGLALLFLARRWHPVIRLLAPVGRMALTWFLFQTMFGVWLFYGFTGGPALMGQVAPSRLVLICLVGFFAQAALARVWLRRFRYGPAEWLWRSLTYWKIQPLRSHVNVHRRNLSD